ncbi:hypothetical protein ACLGCT_00520 [Helicobacter pylori]
MQPFFQKLKGLLVKVGLSLSFGGVCMRLLMDLLAWCKTLTLSNKALSVP